jgi:hypothetical protein
MANEYCFVGGAYMIHALLLCRYLAANFFTSAVMAFRARSLARYIQQRMM